MREREGKLCMTVRKESEGRRQASRRGKGNKYTVLLRK